MNSQYKLKKWLNVFDSANYFDQLTGGSGFSDSRTKEDNEFVLSRIKLLCELALEHELSLYFFYDNNHCFEPISEEDLIQTLLESGHMCVKHSHALDINNQKGLTLKITEDCAPRVMCEILSNATINGGGIYLGGLNMLTTYHEFFEQAKGYIRTSNYSSASTFEQFVSLEHIRFKRDDIELLAYPLSDEIITE